MEPGMVHAVQPGSERVISTRRRRRSGSGVCATPGCTDDAAEGRRFCATHQAVLDRVRSELEQERAGGKAREEMLRKSTRGMRKARWEIERDAAEAEREAVEEALEGGR